MEHCVTVRLQIKTVEVKDATTLTGLIDQIFDKALFETTFCALYASLCKLLSGAMPEFDEEGDPRKVTFRRSLLNKCQAEFEKGDAAMRAAEEVEAKGSVSSLFPIHAFLLSTVENESEVCCWCLLVMLYVRTVTALRLYLMVLGAG